MICLTKLDGKPVVVNEDLILFVDSTPDTMLTMTTGAKLMVKESLEVVVERCAEFRRTAAPPPDRWRRPPPEPEAPSEGEER